MAEILSVADADAFAGTILPLLGAVTAMFSPLECCCRTPLLVVMNSVWDLT